MDRLDRIEALLEQLAASQVKTDIQLASNFEIVSNKMALLAEQQTKTETQLAKTEVQLAKTDAQLAITDSKLRSIGINLGDAAEYFFLNTLRKKMKFGGTHYDFITENLTHHKGKVQREYDIVMYNSNSVAIIETKHHLHINDLMKLEKEQLPDFRFLFPQFKKYDIYLGAASNYVPDNAKEYAEKAGIGLIIQKGDVAEIFDKKLKKY